METFKMPNGKYEGMEISSRLIPKSYLEKLEEDLLFKGHNTSIPLMVAIDKELKRRNEKRKAKRDLNVV